MINLERQMTLLGTLAIAALLVGQSLAQPFTKDDINNVARGLLKVCDACNSLLHSASLQLDTELAGSKVRVIPSVLELAYDLQEWQESAKWCPLCATWLADTMQSHGQEFQLQNTTYISLKRHAWSGEATCATHMRNNQSSTWSSQHTSGVHLESPDVCHKRRYEPITNSRNWSMKTITQARDWLKHCSENHRACQKQQEIFLAGTGRLPARLIDVGLIRELTDIDDLETFSLENWKFMRLVNSSGLPTETKYITLSYPWGSPPSRKVVRHPALTLLRENVGDFYSQIPLHAITSKHAQIFKDAVKVVRQLGYRYLWIDALCIIQDDPDDSLREISSMDQVYANSILSISATSAKDGRDGLIHHRNPTHNSPILDLTPNWESIVSRPYPTYIEPILDIFNRRWEKITYHRWPALQKLPINRSFTAVPEWKWDRVIEDGYLNRRAWVVQERILAPRILHFTQEEVYWECGSIQASETRPDGVRGYGMKSNDRSLIRSWSHWLNGGPDIANVQLRDLYSSWRRVVNIYSRARPSFESDKLVAISGVARRVCKIAGLAPTSYLAGLWEPNLVFQLLWKTGMDASGKLDTYQAPSWSWASMDGMVDFYPLDLVHDMYKTDPNVLAEVTEVNVTVKDNDQFGRVHSGYMKLRAIVIKAKLVTDDPGEQHKPRPGSTRCAGPAKSSLLLNALIGVNGLLFRGVSFGSKYLGSIHFEGESFWSESFMGFQSGRTSSGVIPLGSDYGLMSFNFDDRNHCHEYLLPRNPYQPAELSLLQFVYRTQLRAVHQSREMYLMPLANMPSVKRQGLEGLVLEPTGTKPGQYRRIGTFNLQGYEDLWTQAKDMPNLQPEEYLEPFDEKGRYLIEII